MPTLVLLATMLSLAAPPAASVDATKVLTKDEVAAAIGDEIKEVRPDGPAIVRYYAVHGKPFQEAVIVAVENASNGTYDSALATARKTRYYRSDVSGLGDKAFWEEAGAVYGVLHVLSGKTYISINVGQSKAPQSYLDVAKALMALAIKRL
jgi:hypothetical protein